MNEILPILSGESGEAVALVINLLGTLVAMATAAMAALRVCLPAVEWLAERTANEHASVVMDGLGSGLDFAASLLRFAETLCERWSVIKPTPPQKIPTRNP